MFFDVVFSFKAHYHIVVQRGGAVFSDIYAVHQRHGIFEKVGNTSATGLFVRSCDASAESHSSLPAIIFVRNPLTDGIRRKLPLITKNAANIIITP